MRVPLPSEAGCGCLGSDSILTSSPAQRELALSLWVAFPGLGSCSQPWAAPFPSARHLTTCVGRVQGG